MCAQAEVEEFYTSRGYLIPNFHKVYWMGLTSNSSMWPRFLWLDNSLPGEGRGQVAMLPASLCPCCL
jgi:hypothetical protein